MTGDIRAVLHIGAPKCGSSAVQSALSQTPDLQGQGVRFAYVAAVRSRGKLRLYKGAELTRRAVRSPHGYLSWPDILAREDNSAIWTLVEQVVRARDRPIPILSSEGWIAHPEAFGRQLARWGQPPVMIVAFVRPPLEWLNAAYWQWGVWSGLAYKDWAERSQMSYRFGTLLQAWAELPNVDLRVYSSGADVNATLSDALGAPVSAPLSSNRASSPALLGFLLRNRKVFRPTAHSSDNEFVVQRWCRLPASPPLWALGAADVQAARGETRREIARLMALMTPELRRTLEDAPNWTSERHYHDLIRHGRTFLRDCGELAILFDVLVQGVETVCAATGRRVPALPAPPGADAPIEAWDGAVAGVLRALLDEDAEYRTNSNLSLLGRAARRLFTGPR